jgi:hypothetical protein
MPTLTIGTRTFNVSDRRVSQEAERMFRLDPRRRIHRLDGAKYELARAAGAGGDDAGATKRAAAIILSQGIAEI